MTTFDIFNLDLIQRVDPNIKFEHLFFLKYVYKAVLSSNTKHSVRADCRLVWLQYSKISEDLPYLQISNRKYIQRIILTLVKAGLLYTEHIKYGTNNGSAMYFTITDIAMWCIEDDYHDMEYVFDTVCYKYYKGEDMKSRDYLHPPKALLPMGVEDKPKRVSARDKINNQLKDECVPESIITALNGYFDMRKHQLFTTKDEKYICSYSRLKKYSDETIQKYKYGEMTDSQILDRIFTSTENKWGYIGWKDFNNTPSKAVANQGINAHAYDNVEGRNESSGMVF